MKKLFSKVYELLNPVVSIRRADYWLVEACQNIAALRGQRCVGFNPPGGLLVG